MLYGHRVNLVVGVDALYILAVSSDGVNQIAHVVVAIKLNMRVVDLVLLHDTLHHAVVNFCQWHRG